MAISPRKLGAALTLILLLALLAVYSNHFRNDFHFDDYATISKNSALREAATIYRAFLDARLFSSLPAQQNYRPVVVASLAFDYWLGGGLDPFYFHLSTFVVFCALIVVALLLFRWIMDRADPHPSNTYTAIIAAAVFALHPACAETVNYVIQRADLYNTLGCVAGLWLFARYPAQRRFGWYLLPVAAAILAKPPALVFPLLLAVFVFFFERDETKSTPEKWRQALIAALPSILLAAVAAYLLVRMQPETWSNTDAHPYEYWISQPRVALHYFRSFFAPTDLNVDPGWEAVPGAFSIPALAGYGFVAAALAATIWLARGKRGRPASFGLFWFLATQIPTAVLPLRDLTNDHRMFFPFVGLALSVCWCLRMALFRWTHGTIRPPVRRLLTAGVAIVLAAEALGAHKRNQVWSTDETLWTDSVRKNPRNARAWEALGGLWERRQNYETALTFLQRAAELDPDSTFAHVNLVSTLRALHREGETETHFQRLLELNPPNASPFISYADLLSSQNRFDEARAVLKRVPTKFSADADLPGAWVGLYAARNAASRVAAIRAIDSSRDAVISPGEWLAAPLALRPLDRNGDGKLDPAECGARHPKDGRQWMRAQPLLRALDRDGDGTISLAEMDNSAAVFALLDKNRNGQLDPEELLPAFVVAASARILAALDQNHDGQLDPAEMASPAALPFHDLLAAADFDSDGTVTAAELLSEVVCRIDREKDGDLSQEQLETAIRAGALGPAALWDRPRK